jgi:hypothetical protein
MYTSITIVIIFKSREKLALLLGTRAPREIAAFFVSNKRKLEGKMSNVDEAEVASICSSGDSSSRASKVKLARKGTVRREYQPCNHVGPCRADNCSCLQATGFCEKFCACLKDCKHR